MSTPASTWPLFNEKKAFLAEKLINNNFFEWDSLSFKLFSVDVSELWFIRNASQSWISHVAFRIRQAWRSTIHEASSILRRRKWTRGSELEGINRPRTSLWMNWTGHITRLILFDCSAFVPYLAESYEIFNRDRKTWKRQLCRENEKFRLDSPQFCVFPKMARTKTWDARPRWIYILRILK